MTHKNKCIGVITNLNSKRNKSGRFTKDTLQPIIGEWGFVYDTSSLEEMEERVLHLGRRNIKYLAINGGDGTIQKVLTSWINNFGESGIPHIIPLNGGSTNAVVRHMSLRAYNPITALKRFMNSDKSVFFKYILKF